MSSPRAFLQRIAQQAMRDRGFEPDFSAAAILPAQRTRAYHFLISRSSAGGPEAVASLVRMATPCCVVK
jgi:hypothetical protein